MDQNIIITHVIKHHSFPWHTCHFKYTNEINAKQLNIHKPISFKVLIIHSCWQHWIWWLKNQMYSGLK